MLCECHYQQFEKGVTSDRAYYLHILPLRVIHLFPRNCTNYLTRLEKVRLVVNQGHCVAQVVGEMPTKHLASRTTFRQLYSKAYIPNWIFWVYIPHHLHNKQ